MLFATLLGAINTIGFKSFINPCIFSLYTTVAKKYYKNTSKRKKYFTRGLEKSKVVNKMTLAYQRVNSK
jgi:cytochrome c biogenesis protein CcdA